MDYAPVVRIPHSIREFSNESEQAHFSFSNEPIYFAAKRTR
jgi:hypothetical protein